MDQAEMWPSGLRVLVIDENSSNLALMEELLLNCSYKGIRQYICKI
jgi:two-component response regulator ARR-B family